MAIRLLHRIHRLVTADAHGLVESLEDRGLLLKQHLREAELELQRKRARAEALTDEERLLREDAARLAGAVSAAEEDARLALAEDRDDLARFALRRLIPKQKELARLRARSEALAAERMRLEARRSSQQQEFEALQARIRTQLTHPPRCPESSTTEVEVLVSDDEVELELLRRKRTGGDR
jgi:phage shock protein A